jgi:KUP system potassium uptake protein
LANDSHAQKSSTAALTLLVLGVVFGDIGTSPLYAVKQTFSPEYGIPLTTANILGGLSAIFWSLMIVVSLKYVTLIMRADNKGEGGTIALIALASSTMRKHPRWRSALVIVGLLGGTLFYGDAVITPAISVLSAVEGLEVGTSAFKPYVIPIALIVLIALFSLQRRGTAAVGRLFGPICVLWFLAIGSAGVYNIVEHPTVLAAINPIHAFGFFTNHGFASFLVLGAVLLVITGAEALYLDMGHFGKWPIRIAWFGLVLPALVLNYFGQGALLIANPAAIENPFYLAYPAWALYPMIALATAATTIASQASISGVYSLTKQAIQLGLLPRMDVVHTSTTEIGQVYMPAINWTVLAVVILSVIGFGSSSNLASAYGVAISGMMIVTTFLTFFVLRFGWNYPLWLCLSATGFFFIIDLAFFSSSLLKIPGGGWFPIAIGAFVFTIMMTWRRGREILMSRLKQQSIPLDTFMQSLLANPPVRVPGTAVFLTSATGVVPHALLHNLVHNKVLHERVVFLTVKFKEVPYVPLSERVSVEPLGNECHRVVMNFGFKDQPDVPITLAQCVDHGLEFVPMQTSYFLSRETVIASARVAEGMALWRERLFATMARNAGSVVEYFNLPTNRVIELGSQVEI